MFSLKFLDPGTEVKDYVNGVSPVHVYELQPFTNGQAYYRHVAVTK